MQSGRAYGPQQLAGVLNALANHGLKRLTRQDEAELMYLRTFFPRKQQSVFKGEQRDKNLFPRTVRSGQRLPAAMGVFTLSEAMLTSPRLISPWTATRGRQLELLQTAFRQTFWPPASRTRSQSRKRLCSHALILRSWCLVIKARLAAGSVQQHCRREPARRCSAVAAAEAARRCF
jgi:hypothetical protein